MSKITPVVSADPDGFSRAADILAKGGLVALPTETVYGLAADAATPEAVAEIYNVKGRPSFNPLIAHIFDPDDAAKLVLVSETAQRLIARFWSGPLTLVLPAQPDCPVSDLARAGLDTLAVRCPAVDWTSAFLEAGYRGPVVMPSANRSGHVSPTIAMHVVADLGTQLDLILDGGPCDGGVESTVVSLAGDVPLLLRTGPIAFEALQEVLPGLSRAAQDEAVISPGMLSSHYAPGASVRINAMTFDPSEAILGFGPDAPRDALNLSESGDLKEAAANLFAHLRLLDKTADKIAVMPIPEEGLGAAINDRLRRASAPRPE